MDVLPDLDIKRLAKAGRSERIACFAERSLGSPEVHASGLFLHLADFDSAAHAARPRRRGDRMKWANVRYWHKADIARRTGSCPLSGGKRTWVGHSPMSAFDAVDGAHSAASKCHRVVA